MPYIVPSTYKAPRYLPGGHAQTVYPTLFRRLPAPPYERERIDTPDGDFLDLDWWRGDRGDRLVILSHGLEGSSRRVYMVGMARAARDAGWDALAWNFRGCSGEPNRQLRYYHSGASDDLHTVLRHALALGRYRAVAFIGFSMGGNMTLKLLGELGETVPEPVKGAVTFSVPCDLTTASLELGRPTNSVYMRRFLRMLHVKIRWKMAMFPGEIDDAGYERMRTFKEFDDRYTAPLNGFRDAEDYWRQASSLPLLPGIRVPTLLVNARNDSFLSDPCYPIALARKSDWLHLETPAQGGHTGFPDRSPQGHYWLERRALAFLQPLLDGEPDVS